MAVKAYLSIVSGEFDVSQITARVGLSPSRSVERGQKRTVWAPPATEARWYYDLGSAPNSSDLDSLLQDELEKLGSQVATAIGNISTGATLIRLVLVQTMSASEARSALGLFIRPDSLQWLAMARASIDIDQYLDG